jgi:hypothetical protein
MVSFLNVLKEVNMDKGYGLWVGMSDLWLLHDRDMIGIKGKEGVL